MSGGHGNTKKLPPEVQEAEDRAAALRRERDAAEKRVLELAKKLREM